LAQILVVDFVGRSEQALAVPELRPLLPIPSFGGVR
jgi:hypothetical protein